MIPFSKYEGCLFWFLRGAYGTDDRFSVRAEKVSGFTASFFSKKFHSVEGYLFIVLIVLTMKKCFSNIEVLVLGFLSSMKIFR